MGKENGNPYGLCAPYGRTLNDGSERAQITYSPAIENWQALWHCGKTPWHVGSSKSECAYRICGLIGCVCMDGCSGRWRLEDWRLRVEEAKRGKARQGKARQGKATYVNDRGRNFTVQTQRTGQRMKSIGDLSLTYQHIYVFVKVLFDHYYLCCLCCLCLRYQTQWLSKTTSSFGFEVSKWLIERYNLFNCQGRTLAIYIFEATA